MLARPEVQSYQYSFAGSITLVFASGVGLCLKQPHSRGERRFERPRRGTEDQGRAARARNGGTGGRLRRPGGASAGRDSCVAGTRSAAQSATAANSGRNASGSYFDDVLRDTRCYGIENTTGKVRRPGAVRRRRDAVRTERIVGKREVEVCRRNTLQGGAATGLSRRRQAGAGPEHPTSRQRATEVSATPA